MTLIRSARDIGREIRTRRMTLGYTQQFLSSYADVRASFQFEQENEKASIQISEFLIMCLMTRTDDDRSSYGFYQVPCRGSCQESRRR